MVTQDRTVAVPSAGGFSFRRPDWAGLVSAAALAAGTIAVYSRTFSVPLLLDDYASIVNNLSIRRLWPLGPVLSPPDPAGVGGRPLLNVSYALNYAAGGTAVAGYHLVNLVIHVLAGWTLFALVRRTLRRPVLAARFGSVATGLALTISALWAWHPLQTESVTYVTQRAESLMGLFYLLTLYCFVRGVEAGDRGAGRTWFSLAVLAGFAGAATKEVMVTAPLVLFLYDRTFVSGSFRSGWRKHWPLYSALAATWLLLGYLMTSLHYRGMGFGQGIAWWAYATTECRVVVKYLLLAFWPNPLVFDYGMYVEVPLSAVWPYALALAALLVAAAVALRRFPAAGFAAGWFFLILAPASSIVPIVGEPMAESRLYLPLAGVAALVVLGIFALAGRRSWPVFAAMAMALAIASLRRNQHYRSEQAIWEDTVAANPANPRAHVNLGNVWLTVPGRLNDAVAEYRQALRLKPDYPEAHNNLGNAWSRLPGRLRDAVAEYEEALRLFPNYPEAHYDLGSAWAKVPGRLDDAIAQYDEALRLRPDYAEAHNERGSVLLQLPGRGPEAVAEYEAALRLKPNLAEARCNLGIALMGQPGRLHDAIAQFEETLRQNPDFAEAHYNLGNAWQQLPGRLNDAGKQYEQALRLNPNYAAAHVSLGNILMRMPGKLGEAISHYQAALRLNPDLAEVHSNLGYALNATGRTREAITEFKTALRLKPGLVLAHLNLAVALLGSAAGTGEAKMHLETVLQLQPGNEVAQQILAQIRAGRP